MKKLLIIFILIIIASLGLRYLERQKECDSENGFLWRVGTHFNCIPYRNDMQKNGSYPQP